MTPPGRRGRGADPYLLHGSRCAGGPAIVRRPIRGTRSRKASPRRGPASAGCCGRGGRGRCCACTTSTSATGGRQLGIATLVGSLFAVDAGRVPAAVRARSRADGRRSRVPQHDGRRRRRAVPSGQLARAAEQRRSLLSVDARGDRATAQHSITIEAYIYWAGEIGLQFARALAAAAARGVRVKILLDAVGSASVGSEILQILEKGGCHVAWYNPIRWNHLRRINNRTHRKSLIVDGRIGFTGGAGIADHWTGDAQDDKHWRDLQIRIEGPAVRPLQTGFAQNWLEVHRRAGHRAAFLSAAGRARAISRCRRS